MTRWQAFNELEADARAHANGTTFDQVQRIKQALNIPAPLGQESLPTPITAQGRPATATTTTAGSNHSSITESTRPLVMRLSFGIEMSPANPLLPHLCVQRHRPAMATLECCSLSGARISRRTAVASIPPATFF